MLDVITDFWKPVRKTGPQEKPDVDRLAVGSSITFGPVPQPALAGKTLKVTAVNTYTFGDDRMTSFVLSADRDDSLSLIVADSEGEQYLAISRRVPFAERMKIFDPFELESAIDQQDAVRLNAREVEMSWKQWIMPHYKKEISGLKGSVARSGNGPSAGFDYALLTSENNEYAIEIEKYADGRIEVYATIYRRLNDIAELSNPEGGEAAREKSQPVLEVVKPEAAETPEALSSVAARVAALIPAAGEKPEAEAEPKQPAPQAIEPQTPPTASSQTAPPKTALAEPGAAPEQNASSLSALLSTHHTKENQTMPFVSTPQAANGSANDSDALKSRLGANAPGISRLNAGEENDAIECDLRVANKIIEEAIRNEMRLSDVVRRVIALPVANPESVQIPITLTDSDFSLLAIRYGISASDRTAIKARIIEELGDFSGNKKS